MAKTMLEWAKFDPSPEGPSEYTKNLKGFDLIGEPTIGTVNQGAGSGVEVYPISIQAWGDKTHWVAFTKFNARNEKKTKKVTLTSGYMLDGKYVYTQKTTYEGLEVRNVVPNFSQGEQKGIIYLDLTYTKTDGDYKAYDATGKAKPTAKMKIDMNKGEFE
jgi:hypothetical protein